MGVSDGGAESKRGEAVICESESDTFRVRKLGLGCKRGPQKG